MAGARVSGDLVLGALAGLWETTGNEAKRRRKRARKMEVVMEILINFFLLK